MMTAKAGISHMSCAQASANIVSFRVEVMRRRQCANPCHIPPAYVQVGEASVSAGARRDVQALLLLRCLLLESAALAHLTMTQHAEAQQHILSMRQLYSRFPTLLPRALHSVHMVTGGCATGLLSSDRLRTETLPMRCTAIDVKASSARAPAAPVSTQESSTRDHKEVFHGDLWDRPAEPAALALQRLLRQRLPSGIILGCIFRHMQTPLRWLTQLLGMQGTTWQAWGSTSKRRQHTRRPPPAVPREPHQARAGLLSCTRVWRWWARDRPRL